MRRKRGAEDVDVDVEALSSVLIPTSETFWKSLEEKTCGELKELLSQKWIPSHKAVLEKVYKEKCG